MLLLCRNTQLFFIPLVYILSSLLFPHPLTHDYYPYHIPLINLSDYRCLISLIIYIALIVIAIKGFRRKSIISFSILFYLIPLLLVSNLIFTIGVFMSERFVYFSSFGFCLATGYLISQISKQFRVSEFRVQS